MKNRVQLIGNLGDAPAVLNLKGSNALAKFSIATSERYQDNKGEWQENTYWHQVVAWGNLAVKASEMLKKGDKIALEGKLISRVYEDKDGKKQYITEVVLSNYELVQNAKTKPLAVAA
jgi:single-strand DNA-binding protein